MAEAGIIDECEQLELHGGRLVRLTPEGWEHALLVGRATTRLARLSPDGSDVRSQSTLPLADDTFVEPDVLVVRSRFEERWPRPRDVALPMEFARTNAAFDRGDRALRYARWGAAENRVVRLSAGEVVVHLRPATGGDRHREAAGVLGAVTPPGTRRALDAAVLLRHLRP